MIKIESSANPRYKQLRKLAESSRERHKNRQTLLDGIHLLKASVANGASPEYVVATEAGIRQVEVTAFLSINASLPVFLLEERLFQTISPVENASGVLGVIGIPDVRPSKVSDFCIVLEDIQDPGNLGGILRTAAAAGVRQAYLSKGCVDAWSPKVLRGGMGAHFLLEIYTNTGLPEFVRQFNGATLAMLPEAATSLYQVDLKQPVAVLLGNEGAGLSPDLAALASQQVRIPMPGAMESLNVAAAAAICLFEAVRQRQAGG